MAFEYAYASCETTFGLVPGNIIVNTSDDLATVMTTAYLTGTTLGATCALGETPEYATGQKAKVLTTDMGPITLSVYKDDDSGDISLVPVPAKSHGVFSGMVTMPTASSASTLSLGTAYQNTLGYDVMLTVYLSVTSALVGSILLGVDDNDSPDQQTIVSGITLAALSIVPISIYLPANYYAKLSTLGTISASISGQICMPI